MSIFFKTSMSEVIYLVIIIVLNILSNMSNAQNWTELEIISALEKQAMQKTNVKNFKGEPIVSQVKSESDSGNGTQYILSSEPSVLLFQTTEDYGTSVNGTKDIIVVRSEDSKFAIKTPRAFVKRQYVFLRKFKRVWAAINEVEFYMSFVYIRDPRANEPSDDILSVPVNGTNLIFEYDIWEERSPDFYMGWRDCDHTILFSCSEVDDPKVKGKENAKTAAPSKSPSHQIAKRQASESKADKGKEAEKGLSWLKKKKAEKEKSLPELKPIQGLPGHNPEDYRDLYLDFDFHRPKEKEEKPQVEVKKQEVKEPEPEPEKKKKSEPPKKPEPKNKTQSIDLDFSKNKGYKVKKKEPKNKSKLNGTSKGDEDKDEDIEIEKIMEPSPKKGKLRDDLKEKMTEMWEKLKKSDSDAERKSSPRNKRKDDLPEETPHTEDKIDNMGEEVPPTSSRRKRALALNETIDIFLEAVNGSAGTLYQPSYISTGMKGFVGILLASDMEDGTAPVEDDDDGILVLKTDDTGITVEGILGKAKKGKWEYKYDAEDEVEYVDERTVETSYGSNKNKGGKGEKGAKEVYVKEERKNAPMDPSLKGEMKHKKSKTVVPVSTEKGRALHENITASGKAMDNLESLMNEKPTDVMEDITKFRETIEKELKEMDEDIMNGDANFASAGVGDPAIAGGEELEFEGDSKEVSGNGTRENLRKKEPEAKKPEEPAGSVDLKGVDKATVTLGGGKITAQNGTHPPELNGDPHVIARNFKSADLSIPNTGPGNRTGPFDLTMISGDKIFKDIKTGESGVSVWKTIDFDKLEESARNLSQSRGLYLDWAKLSVLGMQASLRAQSFINPGIQAEFANLGGGAGKVGTALAGTTLNGGIYRGMGFTGRRSVPSNGKFLYGTFYGGTGRSKQFFFMLGSIIRAQFHFQGGTIHGNFQPEYKMHHDAFYPDDEKEAKLYMNMSGIIHPEGFNDEVHLTGGIIAHFVGGNQVKVISPKMFGVCDPNDPQWKDKLYIPGNHEREARGSPLRHSRLKGGTVPKAKFDIEAKLEEEVRNETMRNSEIKVSIDLPSWRDICWTEDTRNGIMYNAGGGKQIFLPLGTMVRATFIAEGENNTQEIPGFFGIHDPHMADEFHPDSEVQELYGKKGQIIPMGLESKLGIKGVLKEDSQFECETQKVRMAVNSDHPLNGKAWSPHGAAAILYRQNDQRLILPQDTMLEAEVKFDGGSVMGHFISHEPGVEDKFIPLNEADLPMDISKVRIVPRLSSPEPLVGISGVYGMKNTFKPDVSKWKIVFDSNDKFWEENTFYPEGGPGISYGVGRYNKVLLLPLMTFVRAQYRSGKYLLRGFFRAGRMDSPDWFHPDDETQAAGLFESKGTLRFVSFTGNINVGLPSSLRIDHEVLLNNVQKVKGLYNWSDPGMKEKYWMPIGSLGILYRGAGVGKWFFVKPEASLESQFTHENSSIPATFIPQGVGHHDILDLEGVEDKIFHGLNGRIVPKGFNSSNMKLGIVGIFQNGNIFQAQKFHGILNLKDPTTLDKLWLPEGKNAPKFDNFGGLLQSKLNLPWKNGTWMEQVTTALLYEAEGEKLLIPKETLVSVDFSIQDRWVIPGFMYTRGSEEVFLPDLDNVKHFHGFSGLLQINAFKMNATLEKGNIFKLDVKRSEVPIKYWNKDVVTPLGVLAITYRGAGESRRFLLPPRAHVRVELYYANESHLGSLVPGDPDHLDKFYPDEVNATELMNGTRVTIYPVGFSQADPKLGIVGTLRNNSFQTLRRKTRILYNPREPLWKGKVWVPKGTLGDVYSVPAGNGLEEDKIFIPQGINIRAEFKFSEGNESVPGYFRGGMMQDLFYPDDATRVGNSSSGNIIPFGDDRNTSILGKFTGNEFKSEVEKTFILLMRDSPSPNENSWRPEGIPGMLYGDPMENEKLFYFPIEVKIKMVFRVGESSIIGDLISGRWNEPDKFLPEYDIPTKLVRNRRGFMVPFGFHSSEEKIGVEGILKDKNLFHSRMKKSFVLYDPKDSDFKDRVYIPGERQPKLLEGRSIKVNRSEVNDSTTQLQDIPEGFPGTLYVDPVSKRRIFLPRRTMTRVEFKSGSLFVRGNFMNNDPGHPDVFYTEGDLHFEDGLQGEIKPYGVNFSIKGMLLSTGFFLSDFEKVQGIYDPYNHIWTEMTSMVNGSIGLMYKTQGGRLFIPVGSRVRAELLVKGQAIEGDFKVGEEDHHDMFFPDDEDEANAIYGEEGTILVDGFEMGSTVRGVLKETKVFNVIDEKYRVVLDPNDFNWKEKVWIVDSLNDDNEGYHRETMKDTRWALDNILCLTYSKDGVNLHLPHGTMVWSQFTGENKTIFGFLFATGEGQKDRFFADKEDNVQMTFTSGMIHPVGMDFGRDFIGFQATLYVNYIEFGVEKKERLLDNIQNINLPKGHISVLIGGAGEGKEFIFHLGAVIRVRFQFGNVSFLGVFQPSDPGRPDGFYADSAALAREYYGKEGKILPIGFNEKSGGLNGIDAVLRPGNLLSVFEEKSKVMWNPEDPVWDGRLWVPEGILGILYNKISDGKVFFLRQGTRYRAEFRMENKTFKGFFLANIPGKQDQFYMDKENALKILTGTSVKRGIIIFPGTKDKFGIKGVLKGNNYFLPECRKVKAFINPQDETWNGTMFTPDGVYGLLYDGAGERKQFFFEDGERTRAQFRMKDISIWGFFQGNGPAHEDFFFPDDELEAKALYGMKGKIIPEGFTPSEDTGIIGVFQEGNKFLSETRKMKGMYNEKDFFWRKYTWTQKAPQDTAMERPAWTPEGKKILYGYLFQGMEESPHIFIAEGDSLSGFFLPRDEQYPEVMDLPHGVFTPKHPAGHGVFVVDNEDEFEYIKEIRGVFLPDALALTGGFSGTINLIHRTNGKFSFVLDRPATEFVYVVGSANVNNIWSVYLSPKEWKFDLIPVSKNSKHSVKKRDAGENDPPVKEKVEKEPGKMSSDLSNPVNGTGLKLKTNKAFAFIPCNYAVHGVLTIIPKSGRLVSFEAELFWDGEGDNLNIKILRSPEDYKVNWGNVSSGLFVPQSFDAGDAICIKAVIREQTLSGNATLCTNGTRHVWKSKEAIWTPVGFVERMNADTIEDAMEAEKDAKAYWLTNNPVDLNETTVPGILKDPHESPKRPENFRFGPLYIKGREEMEEDFMGHWNMTHEYIFGYYIKAVESPEPLFIPDTGIKGLFSPTTIAKPMHQPVTGFYFPQRPKIGSHFLFENGSLALGIKGRFQIFEDRGNLSKGFFYAYIGENTLLLSGDVEIVGGWEVSKRLKLTKNFSKTLNPTYLHPTRERVDYAIINVGGGYSGIVAETLESMDDPNNPLFQHYLQYRAERDGDVNPWGRLAIIDPVERNRSRGSGEIGRGSIHSTWHKEGSMVHGIKSHFTLRLWDKPRLMQLSIGKGLKAKLEPLRLGERINVVNLLDFRMFLFTKFSLKKATALGRRLYIYVPLGAEGFLNVQKRGTPNILSNPKIRNEKQQIVPEKHLAFNFATFSQIEYDHLKLFHRRNMGDAFAEPERRRSDSPVVALQPYNFDEIHLGPLQTAQALAGLEKGDTVLGMDIGYHLIYEVGNELKFTEVAGRFLDIIEMKREKATAEQNRKLKSKISGRQMTTGGDGEGEVSMIQSLLMEQEEDADDQNEVEEVDTQAENRTRTILVIQGQGWKTQHRESERNVTLDKGMIFYGLGNCKQVEVPDLSKFETAGPDEVIDLYLKILRIDCVENVKERLVSLWNDRYLEFDEKAKFFRISKDIKDIHFFKMMPSEMRKLSVAFEFYAVTRTFHHCSHKGLLKGDVLVEPHCTISRSMGFLTEMSFYVLTRAPRAAPSHSTRLTRNLLATLRTVLSKLHQDSLVLKECKECQFDRTITEGDKFRVVSLIQFIINGLGPFEKGQKPLKPCFKEFVALNLEAIRERVEEFGRQFPKKAS